MEMMVTVSGSKLRRPETARATSSAISHRKLPQLNVPKARRLSGIFEGSGPSEVPVSVAQLHEKTAAPWMSSFQALHTTEPKGSGFKILCSLHTSRANMKSRLRRFGLLR